MKYTTFEAINRRLRGRLDVVESQGVSSPWGATLGRIQTDPNLVEQFGIQVESYMNSILRKVYRIPLQLVSEETRAILADITESLVISRLIATYFIGSPIPQNAADVGSLATNERQHGEELLKLYTAGHSIAYLGNPSAGYQSEPVFLDGEIPNTSQQDSITRNYTFIGQRNVRIGDDALGLTKTRNYSDTYNL